MSNDEAKLIVKRILKDKIETLGFEYLEIKYKSEIKKVNQQIRNDFQYCFETSGDGEITKIKENNVKGMIEGFINQNKLKKETGGIFFEMDIVFGKKYLIIYQEIR